jgi:hypothetical protein
MSRYVQPLIVALLGLLAPLWWTWSISQLHYQIFLLFGSPDRPSQVYAWSAILAIPLVLGFAVGAIIYLLMRQSSMHGWSIFWTSLVIGSAIFGLVFGIPYTIFGLLTSPGTWSFAAGSAASPFLLRRYAKQN